MADEPVSTDEGTNVIRAWFVGEEIHCALQPDLVEDPAVLGAIFAAIVRSVADELGEAKGTDAASVLRMVREAFLAELEGNA